MRCFMAKLKKDQKVPLGKQRNQPFIVVQPVAKSQRPALTFARQLRPSKRMYAAIVVSLPVILGTYVPQWW